MSWTSMRRSFIAAFVFLLVFGGTLALAQSGTTSLRGTVLDKSGAAIVGARVPLSSESQGLHRDTTTNSAGGVRVYDSYAWDLFPDRRNERVSQI